VSDGEIEDEPFWVVEIGGEEGDAEECYPAMTFNIVRLRHAGLGR